MYIYTYIQRCQVAAWKTTRLPTISNNSNSLFFNQPLLEASAAACCVHDRLIEYFYNNDWYDFRLTNWLEHTRRSTLFRFFYFFCSFSFVNDSIGSSRIESISGWHSHSWSGSSLSLQLYHRIIASMNHDWGRSESRYALFDTYPSWYSLIKMINNFDLTIYYDHSRNCLKFTDNVYKNILQLERQITFHRTFAIFDVILIRSYPNFSDRPEFFRSTRTFPIRSEVSNDSQPSASIEKVFQNFNIQNFFSRF